MSMEAIRRAFDERGLPAGEKLTLTGLAWHAGKTTWTAFPGIPTLEAELGLEESAITRHLRNLEDRGLIQRSRRYDQRGHRLTDAFLLWPPSASVSRKTPGRLPRKSQDNKSEVGPSFGGGCPAICGEVPRVLQSAYKDEPSTEPRRTQAPIEADLFPAESKNEPKKKPALNPKRSIKKTVLPAGWPSANQLAWAVSFFSSENRDDLAGRVPSEAEQARDHHLSKNNAFNDWDAAWRMWCRKAIKFERRPGGSAPHRNRQPTAQETVARLMEHPSWPKSQ